MINIDKISLGRQAPDAVNVLIEIPKGSRVKYEFDEGLGLIKLDRVLYSPFYYPANYGLLPQTHAEDGDHLDGLVICEEALVPGVVVAVRPVGLLKMIDGGDQDDKIVSVVADDPRLNHVKDLQDIPPHFQKEVAHFFSAYKTLESKKTKVVGWRNAQTAREAIKKAHQAYLGRHQGQR